VSDQPSEFDLDLAQRLLSLSEVLVETVRRVEFLEGKPKPSDASLEERIEQAVAIIAPNYPEMTEEEEAIVNLLWGYPDE